MTDKSKEVKTGEKLEKAYILSAEVGDSLIRSLLEIPYRYSALVGPAIEELQKAPRADVTLNVPVEPKEKGNV